MNIEKPSAGRSKVTNTYDGLQIIIPSKKGAFQIFMVIFLCAWMGGWLMSEGTVIKELITGNPSTEARLFLTFWLVAWTVGGIFCTLIIIWNIAGKEIISISSNAIRLERKALNVGSNKLYSIGDVKNIRIHTGNASPFSWQWSMEFYGIGGGKLAFDYGLKTIRFASGIDEIEAKHLMELLKDRGVFA